MVRRGCLCGDGWLFFWSLLLENFLGWLGGTFFAESIERKFHALALFTKDFGLNRACEVLLARNYQTALDICRRRSIDRPRPMPDGF